MQIGQHSQEALDLEIPLPGAAPLPLAMPLPASNLPAVPPAVVVNAPLAPARRAEEADRGERKRDRGERKERDRGGGRQHRGLQGRALYKPHTHTEERQGWLIRPSNAV